MQALEALLFVADSPATVASLASALEIPEGVAEQALELLGDRLGQTGALQLVRIAGGYQLCTRAEHAEAVAKFLKPQKQRLSRSLMEVLAIVAYRQPVTINDIDTIRGVQSDYSLKALLERRLVREVGRKRAPGRPMLYGTTQQFLHLFGLNDLAALPEIALDRADAPGQPALI